MNQLRTTFGEAMALLHSEVSEALEAWRSWGISDQTEPRGKPEGVGSDTVVSVRQKDVVT